MICSRFCSVVFMAVVVLTIVTVASPFLGCDHHPLPPDSVDTTPPPVAPTELWRDLDLHRYYGASIEFTKLATVRLWSNSSYDQNGRQTSYKNGRDTVLIDDTIACSLSSCKDTAWSDTIRLCIYRQGSVDGKYVLVTGTISAVVDTVRRTMRSFHLQYDSLAVMAGAGGYSNRQVTRSYGIDLADVPVELENDMTLTATIRGVDLYRHGFVFNGRRTDGGYVPHSGTITLVHLEEEEYPGPGEQTLDTYLTIRFRYR